MSEANYNHLKSPFHAPANPLDQNFKMRWQDVYSDLLWCLEELRDQGNLSDRQSLAYDLLLMLEDHSVMSSSNSYGYRDFIERADQIELLEEVIRIVKSNDRLKLVPDAQKILAKLRSDIGKL